MIVQLRQRPTTRIIGKAQVDRQTGQIGNAVARLIRGVAEHSVDLGARIDVEIRMAIIEHAQNTAAPLNFPVVLQIW
ncbi:hypothetical protein D9M68_781210 [compost metagenome]